MDAQVVRKAFCEGASMATLAELLGCGLVEIERQIRGSLNLEDRTVVLVPRQYGATDAPPASLIGQALKKVKASAVLQRPKATFLPPAAGRVEDGEKPLSAYPEALQHWRANTMRLVWDALAQGPGDLAALVERIGPKCSVPDPEALVGNTLNRMREKGVVVSDGGRPQKWSRK